MKLQLCSLEFWRSLARPSPSPPSLPPPHPPPCQLEYQPRPSWTRGAGEEGGRRGDGSARDALPGLASFGVSSVGAVPGSGGTAGTRLRLSRPPTPNLGWDQRSPGSRVWKVLTGSKGLTLSEPRHVSPSRSPPGGKQDFRIFENTVKCGRCEASHPNKVSAKMLEIQTFPKYSPSVCMLSVLTLGLEMCRELFCGSPNW